MRRVLLLLALAPALFGYVRLNTGGATPVALQRIDNTGIQFYVNNLVVPGVTSNATGNKVTVITANSNPLQAIALAQSAWNQISTAKVNYLPVQSTPSLANPQDLTNVISIASADNDLSVVGGAVAVTVNSFVTGSGELSNGLQVTPGDIVDSDMLLNPAYSFSTDGSTSIDLQAVLTHEFGHVLSANHTGVLGATMYQYTAVTQRFLTQDDLAFVNASYPASGSAAASLGTISGIISANGAGVPYALLTFIDTKQGITIGGVSNPDGTYSQQMPPGNYLIYAEPFNSVVGPGNLYFTTAQAAQAASLSFVSTFLGGNSAPTAVKLAANATVNGVNISVTQIGSGSTPLAAPYIGFGKAGGSGDISTVNPITGPVPIASGGSLDIAFVGTGFDSTLTLQNVFIYGPGITATNITVDPNDKFTINGKTFAAVRLTVTVAAQQNANIATIFISKPGTALSTLSLTGVLVITPPTPTFISASLVNAASYMGKAPGVGAVSPGGIYSLYAPTGSPPNLGPALPVGNGGYNGYGFLSTQLAGVKVTFDGIAAPLFFVYGGQINLQVPFEVAGKTSTSVAVNFFGSASAPVAVPVLNEQPAFFTFTPEGTDSIVINQDGSTNGSAHPAPRSSYVTAYGTGMGNVNGLVTGEGATLEPTLNYNCTIGSISTTAAFVGWSPTTVGLAQFTFQIPSGVPANSTQALKCTDNATGVSTQTGTLYTGN
jgi:uncharacterized protein (TIGR03437 family)